jgi:hypothetical protein
MRVEGAPRGALPLRRFVGGAGAAHHAIRE